MRLNLCFGCMEETTSNPCPYCGYSPDSYTGQPYELPPGTILHGKYLIGKVLGQGGFGITYMGWDLALSRKVAIKEYFPSACVSRDAETSTYLQWYNTPQARDACFRGKELFLKEARKMSLVQSVPQVVHVLNIFEDNHTAYIVMNYVPGETLAEKIRRSGPMHWKNALELLLPAAEAMQQVHAAGLVHRDLSPDNLIIHPDGSVRILDLGAAKDLSLQNSGASMQVAKGGFSPMEQYVPEGSTGPWTDVYALAATLYFAITGAVPPSAVDRLDSDTLAWNLPGLRKAPASLIQTLKKALEIQPSGRIQSMDAFASGLRSQKPGTNRTKVILGILAAAAALIVLLAVLTGKSSSPPPAETESAVSATVSSLPPETDPEETLPEEPDEPWVSNVLASTVIPEAYAYDADMASVFNSRIARYQIVSVTFLDALEGMGADSWDVSAARDGSVMAWTRPNGEVSNWVDGKQVKSVAYDLYIGAQDGINGKYCANLFNGFIHLRTIDFNGCFHTELCESMESMFDCCSELTSFDLSQLRTDRVRNMASMFRDCSFETLDVSTLDTSNVTNMAYMFYSCGNLKSLDLRNFDTSKVTKMTDMFCLASALAELDISSFDTSSVTDISFMFSFTGLKSLDLRHFDTSRVTTLAYTFSNNKSLETVDVTGWDTSKVTSMLGTFSGCKALTSVHGLSGWDFSTASNFDSFMDEGTLVDGKPWKNLFA